MIGSAAVVAAVAAVPAGAQAAGLSTSSCQLAGPYKHVVYIQYDNTHLSRDNPSVPSDLEQVPALKSFLQANGTLSSDEHTPLIAHTAGDIVTSLTGLYPDRNGIGVANSYLQYAQNSSSLQKTPTGGFFSPTAFTYWTDPVSSSSINSPGDPLPNLITDNQQNTPAPWVSFTRAGCDVGAFSIADMELENIGSDINSVFGASSPQKTFTSASADRSISPTDFEGIAIHCSQADSAGATGHSGLCSTANGGVADQLPGEPGGYAGYNGLFGAIYANQVTSSPGSFVSSTQDANGQANGNINDLASPVDDVYDYTAKGCQFCANGTNTGYNGKTISTSVIGSGGHSGFVGGFSPTPAQALGYVASMQESGIPVTFAYIEDAHNAWTYPFQALGPGQATYTDQLRQENQAFQAFFERLGADGINKSNTLFVFTADEGDHFAGVAPTNTGCDGQTAATVCNYPANGIGEQDVNINDALARETGNTVPFDIHFDDAANYYVETPGLTAPPTADDPDVRTLMRELGQVTLTNQQTGATDSIVGHIADAQDQSILHMQTTDPLRTPSFTDFGNPTYYYQTGTCAAGTTPGCPVVGPSYAWNHGGDQPEVDTTWLGMAGPTVAKNGATGSVWTDHTDIRPTMLSMLGLGSDYEQDGGAIAQMFVPKYLPQQVGNHIDTYEAMLSAYNQLNAAVGAFGHASELVSTTASLSPDNSVYDGFNAQLADCQAQRAPVAAAMKADLNNAMFANANIDPMAWNALVTQGNALIADMQSLSQDSTPPAQNVCG
jgi:hypothetical protein